MTADRTPTTRWRARVENTVGLAIVVATGWALWRQRAAFGELLDASWADVAAMGVLVVVAWFASAAQTWVLFRTQGADIGFWENFALAAGSTFANYLPMRVGTVVRGRYMKHVHGLRYARFGSIFGIRTVLLVSASGLLGAIATLGLWAFEGKPAWLLLAVFVSMGVCAVAALLVGLPRLSVGNERLCRIWNDFADGFAMARARPRVSLVVVGLIALQQFSLGLRLFIGFEAFQVTASLWLMMLLAPLVLLVSFVAFTPGGLGLREAAIGYVAFATGYDFSLGLFAGSLDRAVLLLITLVLGGPSFLYVWKRLRSVSLYEGSPTESRTGSRSRSPLR